MSTASVAADSTTARPSSPGDESPSNSASDSAVSVAGTKRSRSDMELGDLAATEALSLSNNGDSKTLHKKDKKRDKKERHGKPSDGTAIDGAADGEDGGGEWQTIRGGRPTKKLKKVPKKDSGNYPALTFNKNARLQSKIQVSDLRNLVTYIFADGTAPQWIGVHHRPSFRKIVTILVPGLEEAMFKTGVDFAQWMQQEDGSIEALERWTKKVATPHDDAYPRALNKDSLPAAVQPLADVFPQLWPVRARGNEKYATLFSPVATFLTAPLPKSASEDSKPKGSGPRFRSDNGAKDVRTRVTEFIATPQEYIANEFVLHPALLSADQRSAFADEPGWVHTDVADLADGEVPEAEIEQGSITAGRKVFAVDCEMCKAADDKFVLTRISVVAWDGEVVMDELVKPDEPIVDYLTQFSGITEAMLAPVTTRLADIQRRLLAILDRRAILVGHSLDSDVRAMQLTHPFIVDTSIVFPHPMAPAKKHALRWLSSKYLNREIQKGHGTARGHDSVEDARTCLDLIKRKCEKGKAWGGSASGQNAEWAGGEGAGENLFHRLARAGTAYRSQGGPQATGGIATGKSTAAVDWGDARRTLCGEAGIVLGGCRSDADVEANLMRAVQGDPDGKVVPGGGVDFVWARMRELEALQGWWNRNKLPGGADPQPAAAGTAGTAAAAAQSQTQNGQGPPTLQMLEVLMAAEADRHPDEEQPDGGSRDGGSEASPLERAVRILARRVRRIHAQLPPCTALVVLSGSGDPRAMSRLQAQRAQHKKEYHTPGIKWDQISVPWTDTEAQQLQQAVRRARDGIAFLAVK
ncbi:RNA exonuclease 1 [Sporothrix schenckii 1099-18]|uniref:RNA exonuclease 1 n=1 Tax=Sporothrix schenckii 1099-18 TaxID=1397361 RepID=A0A0F2LWA3_SPOSC|nr:RNA exonuclease 1 [Sporothrix schenckii 1099-18]KJR81752.1 RNA exonuclease 1 [Sporothrix schenckii 1099-18]